MKRFFLFSFLAGFIMSLAVAWLYPLPQQKRFSSNIEVLTNGGRQEDFMIRWPQDRVSLPAAPERVSSVADGSVFVLADSRSAASAELFRLRDSAGNVVGLASRMAGHGSPGRRGASSSNWVLMIPSRGSLLMSQRDSADVGPVQKGGQWVLPAMTRGFWNAGTRYRITAGPAPGGRGRILRGTGEFSGLTGTYTETWELEKLTAKGRTDGRILLSTITEARP
ncbi:MAG TPA: hypothetical protein ENK16_02315 [Chromatiales bacterium]|nr:hypothetical protein [Chromatiales bacterium]